MHLPFTSEKYFGEKHDRFTSFQYNSEFPEISPWNKWETACITTDNIYYSSVNTTQDTGQVSKHMWHLHVRRDDIQALIHCLYYITNYNWLKHSYTYILDALCFICPLDAWFSIVSRGGTQQDATHVRACVNITSGHNIKTPKCSYKNSPRLIGM
jgi:hypothetical protein